MGPFVCQYRHGQQDESGRKGFLFHCLIILTWMNYGLNMDSEFNPISFWIILAVRFLCFQAIQEVHHNSNLIPGIIIR